MNINLEQLPHCQAVMRIEVPADKVTSERKSITNAFANQAKIPGFRKGKVPQSLIEKRFEKDIAEELESRLVNQGFQEGVKKEELKVITITGIEERAFHPDDTFTFTANVLLAPDFELPDYKNITVQVPRIDISDDNVEQSLENLRQRFADFNDLENQPVEMGGFAVIDYEGSLDGTPLADEFPQAGAYLAKGQDFWLNIAEQSFLPGFCDGLVGANVDDKREVELTLPEDFPFEPLQGKTVKYDVVIKAVKEQILPELDDELAGKIEEGKTLDEIRDAIRTQMTQEAENRNEELKTNQIITWLSERLDFDIPDELVHSETQRQINDIVQRSQQSGVAEDELRQHEQEIINNASGQARMNVKTSFILDEIAEAESITVGQQELLQQINLMAAQYQTPVKKLITQLQKSNSIGRVENQIRVRKTLDFLRSNASVEEVEPPEESEETA
ncbi:MAG: trigger factor [Verrucomicrobiota bacterium]